MNTARTKIRPRVRSAEAMPQSNASPLSEPAAPHAAGDREMSPLPVLARLPEVSVPSDRIKLSHGLKWMKDLDWKRVRRVKLDPNWVAGGVLSLVLLLLLVITLNRSSKPAANVPVEDEAPTWNRAESVPQSGPLSSSATGVAASGSTSASPGSAVSAVVSPDTATVVPQQGIMPQQTNGEQNLSHSSQPMASALDADNAQPNPSSLEGIYYPRTPYAAPVGIVTQTSAQGGLNQAAGRPPYGDEIRTAQRDVRHRAPEQVQSPSGQAQLDGIITKPQ